MKIQEMKSGISHLTKRMEMERRTDLFESQPTGDPTPEPITAPASAVSELDEPRWAVVSFDQMEAGGLTYIQASALMSELEAHKVAGLCIVTDEAAQRIGV